MGNKNIGYSSASSGKDPTKPIKRKLGTRFRGQLRRIDTGKLKNDIKADIKKDAGKWKKATVRKTRVATDIWRRAIQEGKQQDQYMMPPAETITQGETGDKGLMPHDGALPDGCKPYKTIYDEALGKDNTRVREKLAHALYSLGERERIGKNSPRPDDLTDDECRMIVKAYREQR